MTRSRAFRPWPAILLLLTLAAPAAVAQDDAPVLAAADRVLDMPVMESVPVQSVYSAIAREVGIHVVSDPNLRRNPPISIDLDGRTVEQALDLATALAGHFWVAMAKDSVLVAEDTPQNRRTHEPMGLRLFALENVDPKDAMTILRSLLSLRSIAFEEDRATLTVRDTLAKLAATERLLGLIDRRAWEVEVDVRLLAVPEDALRRRMEDREWSRLDSAELSALLGEPGTVVLGNGLLGIVGRKEGLLKVQSSGPAAPPPEAGGTASPHPGPESSALELSCKAQVHGESREVTLDFRLEARAKHPRELVTAEVTARARLPEAESLLLPVLPPPGSPGMLGDGSALALALTPRILSDGDVRPEDLETLWIGTEQQIREP
jgi:hypothetical protein